MKNIAKQRKIEVYHATGVQHVGVVVSKVPIAFCDDCNEPITAGEEHDVRWINGSSGKCTFHKHHKCKWYWEKSRLYMITELSDPVTH